MKDRAEPPCDDAVIKARTGRDWKSWCAFLDKKGGARLAHRELAELVHRHHSAGGWWSQAVAVGYERLRGKRQLYERSDGSFSGNASKTLPMTAAQAHAFFVQPRKRARWLGEAVEVRGATAPKSVRITWPDDTHVDVRITAKGEDKCVVAVEHSKLKSAGAVTKQKAFWRAALERLAGIAK